MSRVRHIGIVVRDLDRALTFYGDLLGLEVVRSTDESGPFLEAILGIPDAKVRTVKLAAPGAETQVELLAFTSPSPEVSPSPPLTRTGPTHVAFTVQNIDDLHTRASAAGIAFTTPPRLSPDGGAKVTFCRDPDGTFLELVELMR